MTIHIKTTSIQGYLSVMSSPYLRALSDIVLILLNEIFWNEMWLYWKPQKIKEFETSSWVGSRISMQMKSCLAPLRFSSFRKAFDLLS